MLPWFPSSSFTHPFTLLLCVYRTYRNAYIRSPWTDYIFAKEHGVAADNQGFCAIHLKHFVYKDWSEFPTLNQFIWNKTHFKKNRPLIQVLNIKWVLVAGGFKYPEHIAKVQNNMGWKHKFKERYDPREVVLLINHMANFYII